MSPPEREQGIAIIVVVVHADHACQAARGAQLGEAQADAEPAESAGDALGVFEEPL